MDMRVNEGHEALVDDLLGAMTLEEKLGQLTMLTGTLALTGPGEAGDAVSEIRAGRCGSFLNAYGVEELRAVQTIAVEQTRLRIPMFFCYDVLHGQRTIFPIPLAEACAFDRALWEKTAAASAQEATADGLHLTFGPMLDVSRDPRWGRMAEAPGEDPYVGAQYAQAKVRGFQAANADPLRRLVACAKHFVAYGAVLAGREYAEVDLSERTLQEVHLPPFRAAVEAGVGAIMPAFHDVNGVPMTAHTALLRDRLRGEWGFDGLLISDYNAIAELMNHGVAADIEEAAALALDATLDIDMMAGAFLRGLPGALARGRIDMQQIDAAVRRVLRFKARLGLFDNPYAGLRDDWAAQNATVPWRGLARESAQRSAVLLENRDDFLPLRALPKRVAVIGPFADLTGDNMGPWFAGGLDAETVGLLQGLRDAWPTVETLHAKGVDWRGSQADVADIAAACHVADQADLVVLCLGETSEFSGEGGSRAYPDLPLPQRNLARALLAQGKPVIVVLVCGRPLVMPDWLARGAQAVLALWFAGTEAGHALADLLDGTAEPGGRLSVSWPMTIGQIPVYLGLRPTGRPHQPGERFVTGFLDSPIEPRYPFGHGLSYADIVLEDVQLDRTQMSAHDTVVVTASLRNASARAGACTLFMFIHDPVARVTRPRLELKDFTRIDLQPGEAGRVSFLLRGQDCAYLDASLQPRLDDGDIAVCVGFSADPLTLRRATLRIAGA